MKFAYKLFLFLPLFVFFVNVSAQFKPVHTFQQDDTLLRQTFYEQALQQKNELISSLDKTYKEDYKEVYEARFEEVQKLLQGTRTVTEAKAHAYLQSVLKKITEANPELKALPIRMVFTRDGWPNAYSMGEGTLAVNAGLLIYLSNEAELVFVLCHELAHLYLDHGNKMIRKNVELINSEAFKAEVKRISRQEYGAGRQIDELLKRMTFGNRRHSRDNEAEADRQAFSFMKKTGYDCQGILTCLTLLDKVDDSLLFQPVNPAIVFHFADYPFKNKWIHKESVIFGAMNQNDSPLTQKEKDSLKTHPDCSQRMLLLKDSVQAVAPGRLFLTDETLFTQLKRAFIPEIAEQQYRNQNLARHLYLCMQMLQRDENKPYAVYSIVRCFNQLYEHQKNHQVGLVTDKENRQYPDDYNLVLRMLDRLRLEELARIGYEFGKKYKEEMSGYEGFAEEYKKAVNYKSEY